MSRVINPTPPAKKRKMLLQAVVIALHELGDVDVFKDREIDLVSFIVLSLSSIARTIDATVEAWEKRGYWLKADRFRLEWLWTQKYGRSLYQSIQGNNWNQVKIDIQNIAVILREVEIPKKHRLGQPWLGAWNKLKATGISDLSF